MDVVVTGAAGFIGSNLTDALVDAGHDVLAVDDLSSGVEADVNPRARWLQADVADLDADDRGVRRARGGVPPGRPPVGGPRRSITRWPATTPTRTAR